MNSSPVHGSARLENGVLTIRRKLQSGKEVVTEYRVEALNPDPEVGFPGLRLIALDGSASVYDLLRTSWGIVCDCPDYKARRENVGAECKHLAAARSVGLIGGQQWA